MALAFVWMLQDFVEHHFLSSIFGCRFVLSVAGCMLYDCCKFLRNFSPVYVLHVSSPFISVMWIIRLPLPENTHSLRLHIGHHLLCYVTHTGHCHTASLLYFSVWWWHNFCSIQNITWVKTGLQICDACSSSASSMRKGALSSCTQHEKQQISIFYSSLFTF